MVRAEATEIGRCSMLAPDRPWLARLYQQRIPSGIQYTWACWDRTLVRIAGALSETA